MQQLPEVWWQGPRSHSSLDGRLSPELLSGQQAVESVEDAGQTHGFPPQGGRDGVDGTEFWNQNLTKSAPVNMNISAGQTQKHQLMEDPGSAH